MSRGETCEDGMGQSAGSLEGSVSGGGAAKGSVAWGGARDWKKGHDRECVGFGKRRNCTKGAGAGFPRAVIQGLDSSDSDEIGEQIRRDRRVVEVLEGFEPRFQILQPSFRGAPAMYFHEPVPVEVEEDPFPVSWEGLEGFGIVNDGEKLELVQMDERVVEAVEVELADVEVQAIVPVQVVDVGTGLVEVDHSFIPKNYLFTPENVREMNEHVCGLVKEDLEERSACLEGDLLTLQAWMNEIDENYLIEKGIVTEDDYQIMEEFLMHAMQHLAK
jgi:hypothetical protein